MITQKKKMAIYFYQNIYPNSKSIKEKKKNVKKENKIQIVLYIYLDIMKKIKGKKKHSFIIHISIFLNFFINNQIKKNSHHFLTLYSRTKHRMGWDGIILSCEA